MATLHPFSLALCWRRGAAAMLLVLILPLGAQAAVVDASGWATPEAVQACQLIATAHQHDAPATAPSYVAVGALSAYADRALRRPPGSERVDAVAQASYTALLAPLTPSQRQQLAALFARMGDVGPVHPAAGTYDYIFIHGSTVPSMRRRVMALADAWARGDVSLRPGGQVVFLDGERRLFASETIDVLLDTAPFPRDPTFTPPGACPQNEREAAEMVWRQLQLPEPLRRLKPVFAHAPAAAGAARAHTRDVVQAWAESQRPRPGRALMVSDNPYVEYQRLVTVRALRAQSLGISVEAMGAAGALTEPTADLTLGVQLDNLAATLAEALALQSLDEQDIQPGNTP